MTKARATTRRGDGSRAIVEHKLRGAWHKERRFLHTRGLCFLLVWAVALVLLDLLVDWLFLASYRAPGWARTVLLAINAAALLGVAYVYWWRHLRRYDPVRLALEFERKHPELKSLLVSYVQIDDDALAAMHASPVLVAALRREAVEVTRPMDFREIVSFKELGRLLAFSACVLAGFGGVSAYKSEFFRTLMDRMLHPAVHVEYPTRTTIDKVSGNLSVQQGASVQITATCAGEIPRRGRLHVRADGGEWEALGLARTGADAFAHTFRDVRASFDYYVRLGDDESSRYRVEVVPGPKVVRKRIGLTYPEHTGLAPEQRDSYYVEAPEGTGITWWMRCDRPVQSAELIRDRQDANALALRIRQGGYVVEGTVRAEESFEYQFRWKLAGHDFVYTTPGAYLVHVLPDRAPEIEILQPVEDEKATVRKTLSVTFKAGDDYGLGAAKLVYAVGDGPERTWPIGVLGAKSITRAFDKKLAELIGDLAVDQVVTYCVEVADNRPRPGGPNVTRSRKRRVYIVDVAEYLRSILEQQLRWVAEVEELRGEERQAETHVGEIRKIEVETQPATRPSNE